MATLSSSSPRTQSLRCQLRQLRRFSTSPPPDHSPFSSIVSVDPVVKRLARSRRLSELEALLESRKKSRRVTHEPYLASIIVSYAYAKMLRHASRTFDQMEELGCIPRTAVSLNALLTSYNHTGNHSRVPEFFAELSRKHSIKPDRISYAILINALCESGTPEKAYAVLEEMEEKRIGVSAITYTPIIDALYRKKKPEEAEKLWNEMVGRGCIPDVASYNVRAVYSAHHGKPEEVLQVIEEMELEGLKPDIISYNLLITCYCKNGKYSHAKSVYKSLREKKLIPNMATYRNFMYFLCKYGDFDAGFDVCKEAVRKNKIPDIGPMKMLLQGLVKNSREKDARWLIRKLKEKFSPGLLKEWEKVEEEIGLSIV